MHAGEIALPAAQMQNLELDTWDTGEVLGLDNTGSAERASDPASPLGEDDNGVDPWWLSFLG